MRDFQLLVRCTTAALTGLCAHPYHQAGEHPNTGSTAVVDRAIALGKELADKLEAEVEHEDDRDESIASARHQLEADFRTARSELDAARELLEAERAKLTTERAQFEAERDGASPADSEPKADEAAPAAESKKKR